MKYKKITDPFRIASIRVADACERRQPRPAELVSVLITFMEQPLLPKHTFNYLNKHDYIYNFASGINELLKHHPNSTADPAKMNETIVRAKELLYFMITLDGNDANAWMNSDEGAELEMMCSSIFDEYNYVEGIDDFQRIARTEDDVNDYNGIRGRYEYALLTEFLGRTAVGQSMLEEFRDNLLTSYDDEMHPFEPMNPDEIISSGEIPPTTYMLPPPPPRHLDTPSI